jgi:hypothetical protein
VHVGVVGQAQLDGVDLQLGCCELVDRAAERPQPAPVERCAHRGAEVDVGALATIGANPQRDALRRAHQPVATLR